MSRGGMPSQQTSWWGRTIVAASASLALFAGGCSSGGVATSDAAHGYSGSGSISDMFTGSSAKGPQTVAGAQPDVNCPPVEIRRGASTLSIAPPGDKSAMTLKYQGSFARAARECSVIDGNMAIKVGVEGRLIVGPAGGPGQVNVPIRFAVVQETPGGVRPIATKFVVVPVIVGADGNTLFTHVEDAMTFPVPAPTSLLDDYIVYIGFDPLSAEAQSKQPPNAKPRPQLKPKPAASAN